MTREQALADLENIVKESTGMLATNPQIVDCHDDIPELIDELVRTNRIVKIEYVLPNMASGNKSLSLLLPKGTKVTCK